MTAPDSGADAAAELQSAELAAPFVNIEADEAVEIARTRYGIEGVVTRFASEKDDTFRLDAEDGRRFVLKISNPSEQRSEIELQVDLIRHIERVAPQLPVPRILADRQGHWLDLAATRAGPLRFVRLLSYLPGTPLDRSESTAAGRERIGEVLAKLRNAMAAFTHPADSRKVAWDVRHLPSLRNLLPHLTVPAQRRAAEAAFARFAEIEPILARSRMQVLHNDFNTANIVVDPSSENFVTGIIDFGDAVRTAIAVDVSTALMNQLPRATPFDLAEDIFESARDLVRGYLRHADLTAEELALIPHLAMARVAARGLLTTWRARLFPNNAAYILRNTAPGWNHLDWFLHRSPLQISQLLASCTP